MAIETSPRLDPEVLRRDFPILATTSHGRPLVYLDSASTSQKPAAVIEAVNAFYREYNANVHRGIYDIGERSTTRPRPSTSWPTRGAAATSPPAMRSS